MILCIDNSIPIFVVSILQTHEIQNLRIAELVLVRFIIRDDIYLSTLQFEREL